MKKAIFILFMIGFYMTSRSQSLSPFVISSTGGFFVAGGISLSSTTGEMTMVETFTDGTYFLTQGFQQPNDLNVGIRELPSGNSASVFPNPNSGQFFLLINLKTDAKVMMKIYDALGREVYFDKLNHASGVQQFSLQLENLVDGIYWMKLYAVSKSGTLFHDTQKINIIH